MPSYAWLSYEMIENCFQSLENSVSSKETFYEAQVSYECDDFNEYGPIIVSGRIDALDKTNAFELKCVESLSLEHFLQVVIYSWIWKKQYLEDYGIRNFKILNMKNGEIYSLDSTSSLIDRAMNLLFENKYCQQKKISDKEFIETCLSTRKDIDFIYRRNECMIIDE